VRASGTTSTSGGTLNIDAGTIAIMGSVDARVHAGRHHQLNSTGDISVGGNTTTPGISARAVHLEVGGRSTSSAPPSASLG
jgi:hypothetical protein